VQARALIAAGATFLAALALASPAAAKPTSDRIQHGKGVGGVNLNLRRGPLVVRRGRHVHKVHTVNSMLGRPQSVHELPRQGQTEAEKTIYLANYTDDKLSVYYSKRDAKGKIDNKRDANDKVFGVVTYTSKYFGNPNPGQPFPDGEADGPCVPLDAHVAPDGGPRRAAACKFDPPGNALEIIYLSGGSASRAGQVISQVGVFNRLVGIVIYQSLLDGALMDLNCQNIECTSTD
jgi:hypothetical protein